MKRALLVLAAVGAFAAAAGVATPAGGAPGERGSDVNRDLAIVRRATAKYHDVQAAIDAGYTPTDECVALPGVGTMGLHYVNFGLVGDPSTGGDNVVDLEQPEALLYIPQGNGVKLVAVEWVEWDNDQDLSTAEDRPSLFGQGFEGPMTHGLPVHYDRHAWVWHANPDGVFADWNPSISCPEE